MKLGFKKEKIKGDLLQELKSIAHFNLGQIQKTAGEHQKAIKNYREAIQLSKEIVRPAIVLALIGLVHDKEEKFELIDQLVQLICQGKISPNEKDSEKPIDFNFDDLRDIFVISYLNFKDSLFEKLKPFLSLLGEKTAVKHLVDLAIYKASKKDWDTTALLLEDIIKKFKDQQETLDDQSKYTVLKLLSYLNSTPETGKYSKEYIETFKLKRYAEVDYVDMEIFANLIYSLSQNRQFQDALYYVSVINSVKDSVASNILINYLVIFHLELNLYMYLDEMDQGKK